MIDKDNTVNTAYTTALQLREQANLAALPEEQSDLLAEACEKLLGVVDRLAMQSSAVTSTGDRLAYLLNSVKMQLNPESCGEADRLLGIYYLLQKGLQPAGDFAKYYNYGTRDRILRKSGIDLEDSEAVTAFFDKARRVFFEPSAGCN
jgi:hypothetical protein